MGSSSSQTISLINHSSGRTVEVRKEDLLREIGWVRDHRELLKRKNLSFPSHVRMSDEVFLAVVHFIQGHNPTITRTNRDDLHDVARLLDIRRLAQYIDQQQGDVCLCCRDSGSEGRARIPRGRVMQRLGYFRAHPEELDREIVDMSVNLTIAQFWLLVQDLRGEDIEVTDRNFRDLMHICTTYNNEVLEQRLVSEHRSISEAIQDRQDSTARASSEQLRTVLEYAIRFIMSLF